MNLDQFNAQPLEERLASIFLFGTFLATRFQAAERKVNLYELPGLFFVEVAYHIPQNKLIGLLSFGWENVDRLETYARFVKLPEDL